jgi:hypothetical protein
MKTTLRNFRAFERFVPESDRPRVSSARKVFAAMVFSVALAFAPAPAFAQHGGGGGGGGGSHGGGGGGGAHAGSAGGAGGGAHAATPAGAHAGSSAAANNAAGHWWNPFHSASSNSSPGNKVGPTGPGGTIISEPQGHGEIERFAAGNNIWQDPPSGHGIQNGARPVAGSRNSASTAPVSRQTVVGSPPHVFPPRRPIYPYYPFYPYYPGYGFGWGLGLGYGLCDPFWGCYGYGFDYGYGGGFGYYGGSFGDGYNADLGYNSSQNMDSSQEPNPYLYAVPSTDTAQSGATAPVSPYVMLYLKDGSTYAVSDYWLAGGRLHYVTSYGGENVIEESQLDLQRTVNENAKRGVEFTLRPEPAGATATGSGTEEQPAAPQPRQ